jgi:hypothetical protein
LHGGDGDALADYVPMQQPLSTQQPSPASPNQNFKTSTSRTETFFSILKQEIGSPEHLLSREGGAKL